MLKLLYTPTDAALAARLETDLRGAGYDFTDGKPVLIPILSPAALNDATINAAINAALDRGEHITPVIAAPITFPRLIDHLAFADFTEEYALDALKTNIDAALSPEARLPLAVLTPSRQKANRSFGLIMVGIVLFMFVVGLYAVGVLKIQMPQEEYDAIDTEVALTIQPIVAPVLATYAQFLPRSTDEAANYAATLRVVPTVYRPLMAATATAYAEHADDPVITQRPTSTP